MAVGGRICVVIAWVAGLAALTTWSYTDGATVGVVLLTVIAGALIGQWWVVLIPALVGIFLVIGTLPEWGTPDSDGTTGSTWALAIGAICAVGVLLLAGWCWAPSASQAPAGPRRGMTAKSEGRGQRTRPLALALCGVALLVAVVLAGYFGWCAVWLLTPVAGDENVPTRDRIAIEAFVVFIAGCFGYVTFSLIRYLQGREIRWWAVGGVYLAGLLCTPVAWAVLLANFSGG